LRRREESRRIRTRYVPQAGREPADARNLETP